MGRTVLRCEQIKRVVDGTFWMSGSAYSISNLAADAVYNLRAVSPSPKLKLVVSSISDGVVVTIRVATIYTNTTLEINLYNQLNQPGDNMYTIPVPAGGDIIVRFIRIGGKMSEIFRQLNN